MFYLPAFAETLARCRTLGGGPAHRKTLGGGLRAGMFAFKISTKL